ncbi:MAG: hypothetical protein FI719_08310 [SAR202 cluster bacterium]|nr:hypothetical protein [SAR202 cluster bacterium]|tara:strand:- start:1544 stop:2674 length:1131 start_codon:yes stop_codon:yes gene_type:complete
MDQKARYLFINSMSRSGTSLLYQLIYGHPDIFFPPFRIQFACSDPLGFPATHCVMSNEEFSECLLEKTTTPVNVTTETQWSNIQIETLCRQGVECNGGALSSTQSTERGQSSLDRAIDILHTSLRMKKEVSQAYYCLHDDHSYVLGAGLLSAYSVKVVTTIRSPLDMLASKKNMLLFHLFKTTSPTDYRMCEMALKRELARAIFSWLVASYEYSRKAIYYPILFEHMKGGFRDETMARLMEHLDLEYCSYLNTDQNELPQDTPSNELLYAGSSLQQITDGNSDITVGSSNYSLTEEEQGFLFQRIDDSKIQNYTSSNPAYFYSNFHTLWKNEIYEDLPVLDKWMDWYVSGNNEELFREYSNYNYGFSNASAAFLLN